MQSRLDCIEMKSLFLSFRMINFRILLIQQKRLQSQFFFSLCLKGFGRGFRFLRRIDFHAPRTKGGRGEKEKQKRHARREEQNPIGSCEIANFFLQEEKSLHNLCASINDEWRNCVIRRKIQCEARLMSVSEEGVLFLGVSHIFFRPQLIMKSSDAAAIISN